MHLDVDMLNSTTEMSMGGVGGAGGGGCACEAGGALKLQLGAMYFLDNLESDIHPVTVTLLTSGT